MAYSKKIGQCTVGLDIIPCDVCDIPYPGDIIFTGRTAPAPVAPEIIVLPGTDTFPAGMKRGDIVYNRTTRGAGYVLAIHSSFTNCLVTAVAGTVPASSLDFSAGSQDIEIYRCKNLVGNEGRAATDKPCMVFPSEADSTATGGIRFTSAGGDVIGISNFGTNVPVLLYGNSPTPTASITGSPFPFQIKKLWETDASGLSNNLDKKFYATW